MKVCRYFHTKITGKVSASDLLGPQQTEIEENVLKTRWNVKQVTHLLFHNKLLNTTKPEELTAQTFLAQEKH